MSTLGTGVSLLTGLCTCGVSSNFGAEGMLAFIRTCSGVATYATNAVNKCVCCKVCGSSGAIVALITGCCMPVVDRIMRPICTVRMLVGINLVNDALDLIAGSESEYHSSENNNRNKQFKVSLHNRDPP